MAHVSNEHLDKTFAALSHPIRRAILTRLARDGSASVSDLARPFDVSLMAVSKHLRVMDRAGLIRREKDGRVRRCSYEPGSMEVAREWIEKHRVFWTNQLDSLAAYLEAPAGEDGGRGENAEGRPSPPDDDNDRGGAR